MMSYHSPVITVWSDKFVYIITRVRLLHQVKPVELADFLQVKKGEGYCIVGVEQTANSQSLQDYQFPEKTLLLLGYDSTEHYFTAHKKKGCKSCLSINTVTHTQPVMHNADKPVFSHALVTLS